MGTMPVDETAEAVAARYDAEHVRRTSHCPTCGRHTWAADRFPAIRDRLADTERRLKLALGEIAFNGARAELDAAERQRARDERASKVDRQRRAIRAMEPLVRRYRAALREIAAARSGRARDIARDALDG